MSGSTITISIRAANQHNKDHAIVCEKQWQVKKLKELIAETYAGNPAPNDQRLIYGGKYLLDNEVLSSVLQASNIPNIVHLVTKNCTKPSPAKSNDVPTPSTSKPTTNPTLPTELRHRNTASSSQTNPATQQYSNWHQMYNQQQYPYQFNQFNQPQMTTEQYSLMWQQYHQQMAHYMQYYGVQGSSMMSAATVQQQSTPDLTPNPEPNVAAPPNHPDPIRQAPDNNPPMNAQGGFAAADDDDLMRRDWLDVFFTLLRGGFFLSIMYYYSSFWRFAVVFSLFLILYIYQSGFFQVQRRQPPPQQPDNNNNGEMSTDENAEQPQETEVPPPPSLSATAWCFVSTFFTSLIPQGPPVAN